MKGWITLHRKIEENELWLSEPFSRGQAWVDLLLIANHKPQLLYKRNIAITIERGQVGWSQEKLAKRWRWGRRKVATFLKTLENAQQIIVKNNYTLSHIIIVNYDKYQQMEQQSHNSRTTDRTNNNNVNNVNNIGETSSQLLKDNENDMGWNKHSEDYEEGVVDLETGDLTNPEEDKKAVDVHTKKRMNELTDWLIEYQGRDKLRTNRPKQFKALGELLRMKVTGAEAQQIIMEQMQTDYWRGKKEKPDFSTVVAIIQKRGE